MTVAATLATAPLIAHPLRRALDRLAARQPARPARGRARDVAGDAGLPRRTGARGPGGAAHLARRPAARLRRPGRALARPPAWARVEVAPTASAACWPPTRRCGTGTWVALGWRRAGDAGSAGRPVRRRAAVAAGGPRAGRVHPRARPVAGPESGQARRPACGSRSSTSARATRSCSSPPTASRCWSTAGPHGDELRRPPRARRASPSWRRRSSPTISPTTSAASRSCSASSRSAGSSTRRRGPDFPARRAGRGRPGELDRGGVRAATRAPCASMCVLAATGCARRPPRPADPNRWRWCCWPAGTASRCCSPPTPRPRSCRSTQGPWTCSRSPTTAPTTPASAALLDRTAPSLAVISVGADNPYGHPTADTLSTLAEHRVPTVRTDQAGDVTIDVARSGWTVEAGSG